jgi:hypothetical protein
MPLKVQLQHLPLRIPKPKLLRSNPLRKSLILGGSDPSNVIDDEDIITSYRRRDLNKFKTFDPEDEVSDYVLVRLAVARAKAMEAYRKAQA